MRIVIKNADFSSVSIGKVTKDLSFNYVGDDIRDFPWDNISDKTVALPWVGGLSSNVTGTTILLATSEASSYTVLTNNNNRIVSDFIEVVPGMVITSKIITGTNNIPFIVCYNANKEALGPSSTYNQWSESVIEKTFTIPEGVKYIKIQSSGIKASVQSVDTVLKGEMPE